MNNPIPSRIVIYERSLSKRNIEHIKSQIEKMFPGSNVTMEVVSGR